MRRGGGCLVEPQGVPVNELLVPPLLVSVASWLTLPSALSASCPLPCSVVCPPLLSRFLAAHHDCLRPLGKCSLAELGLANGSLHLAAGPTTAGGNSASCSRPPPLSPAAHAPPFGGAGAGGGGGASAGGGSCWGGLPGTPPSHSHMPAIPSSPKPPLGRSSLDLTPGGGGERQDRSILSSSPVGDSAPILSIGLQRGGSGGLGPNNFNSSGGTGGFFTWWAGLGLRV